MTNLRTSLLFLFSTFSLFAEGADVNYLPNENSPLASQMRAHISTASTEHGIEEIPRYEVYKYVFLTILAACRTCVRQASFTVAVGEMIALNWPLVIIHHSIRPQ